MTALLVLLCLRTATSFAFVATVDSGAGPVKVASLAAATDYSETYVSTDGRHATVLYQRVMTTDAQKARGAIAWHINIDGTDCGPYDDIIPSYAYPRLAGSLKGFAGVDVSVPWFIYRVSDKWTLRLFLPSVQQPASAPTQHEYPLSGPRALRQLTCNAKNGKCVLVTARDVTVFRPHTEPSHGLHIGTPLWAAVIIGIVDALPKWTEQDVRFSLHGAVEAGEYDNVGAVVLSPTFAHHAVAFWQGHASYVKVDDAVYQATSFTRAADNSGFGFFYKQGGKLYVYLNGDKRGPFAADSEALSISSDLKHYALVYKKHKQRYVRVDDQEFGGYDQIANPPAFSDDGRNYWFGHYRYDDFPRVAININGIDRGESEANFPTPFFGNDGQWRFVMKNAEGYFANTNGKLQKLCPAIAEDTAHVLPAVSLDQAHMACSFMRDGRWFLSADGQTYGGYDTLHAVEYAPDGSTLSFVSGEGLKRHLHIRGKDYDVGESVPRVSYVAGGQRFWFTYGGEVNIDGVTYPWKDPYGVYFSKSGRRFAYAWRAPDARPAVNVDGTLLWGYDFVDKVTFSHDEAKLGFEFRKGDATPRRYVYIDGREYGPFASVDYVFGEHGEAVLVYVKDGALYRLVVP